MMTPATAAWTPKASASTQVRAAFATLDRAQQRLIEVVVFEGRSCAWLAQVLGVAAVEVRHRVATAMRALAEQVAPPGRDRSGAVEAMLALRALDALDRDEAALIDVMLVHRPALQRDHAEYEALVGELCLLVPRSAPAPGLRGRLSDTIAALAGAAIDDAAN